MTYQQRIDEKMDRYAELHMLKYSSFPPASCIEAELNKLLFQIGQLEKAQDRECEALFEDMMEG